MPENNRLSNSELAGGVLPDEGYLDATPSDSSVAIPYGVVAGWGMMASHYGRDDVFGEGKRSNDHAASKFSEIDPDETFRL